MYTDILSPETSCIWIHTVIVGKWLQISIACGKDRLRGIKYTTLLYYSKTPGLSFGK